MFDVKMTSGNVNGLSVKIAGCPSNGTAAIDFRRQHGLPEAPNNHLVLPPAVYRDESVARTLPLDGDADFRLGDQTISRESYGKLNTQQVWLAEPMVTPTVLANYLRAPSAQGIAEIYADIVRRNEEYREAWEAQKAQERAEREAEAAKLAEARELLADDIEGWRRRSLRQNEMCQTLKDKQKVLATFLTQIPLDALRDTARRVAGTDSDTATQAVIDRIEDASPVWIFSSRDDEDSED